MRAFVLVLMIGLGLAGCGSKNKSTTDGGAASNDSGTTATPDSGTAAHDSGTNTEHDAGDTTTADAGESRDSGAGDAGSTGGIATPAAGKATITATFSAADTDYNGTSTPYTGVEAMGSTELNGGTYYFKTHDATFRAVVVQLGEKPVQGKTYMLDASNMFTLGAITFSEAPNINAAKQFKCFGSVTVDSATAPTYTFHFTGDCSPNAGTAAGKVTITGEGAGTF
jgi:hypothetical protein